MRNKITRKDLRVEIGLAGRESSFLSLAMDGLALADDQGMRFSFNAVLCIRNTVYSAGYTRPFFSSL